MTTLPENAEKSIDALKQSGAKQMECVMVLRAELNISLHIADKMVLNFNAWKANRAYIIKFKDDFGDFVENS